MQALLVQQRPSTAEKLVHAVEKKLESYSVTKAGWRCETILERVMAAAGATSVNPSRVLSLVSWEQVHDKEHLRFQQLVAWHRAWDSQT